LAEFIDMGGYGPYVWSAFGLSFTVLLATVWLTKRGLRQTRARLARRLQSAGQRESATEVTP